MVVDPMATERPGVALHQDASTLPDDLAPEVVVLAVKPQQMDAMLSDYAPLRRDRIVCSCPSRRVKPWAYFEATLGPAAAIVRAMPNTPAAIGQGITVACPNANATAAQSAMAEALLGAVGEAVTVPDEGLMDAVTALSGGGPAYTFLLIETMAAAGEAAGLPKELAARLALVTVAGAGQLALASDTPPSTLRENVTSPGGTTLEALKVLMRDGDGLPDRMVEAIAAATNRSRELGG
jgi:pyrroline-5-carboxylate reductase